MGRRSGAPDGIIVMQFVGNLLPYDFLTELNDIWAGGQVRPNAFVLLRKDRSGKVSGMEGGRIEESDDIAATNALIAAITSRSIGPPELKRSRVDFGGEGRRGGRFRSSVADIRALARKIPRGHSAIAILVENVWERTLKQTAAKHPGDIVSQRLISSAAVAKAASRLASAGKGASSRGRRPRIAGG